MAPTSTTCSGRCERSRKGDVVHRSYEQDEDLRPAAAAGPVRQRRRLFRARTAARRAEHPQPQEHLLARSGVRKYTNTRKSLGGVDHEKGIAWRARRRPRPCARARPSRKLCGGIDYGVPLPVSNSSAWIYAQAGIAGGERRTRWRLSISARSATTTSITGRRNGTARWRAFPGFEIDEIAARRFAKLTGEVNLPPIRFAEIGTPAFYLSHIRPAVFAGTMATQTPDGKPPSLHERRRAARLQFHRRAAAADGVVGRRRGRLGDGDYRKTEWLASLKIM